jgi:SAM-dependent methyltransferase
MNKLIDKRLNGIDIDSPDRVLAHRQILKSKKMIQEVFLEFHGLFNDLDRKYFFGNGSRIEIGTGSSPIKESFPDVLATDIVQGEGIDIVIDASNMSTPNSSIRAIFAQNVFHHLPDPSRFFSELDRVLLPGGGAVLIEPYYGIVASALFKRISKYEHFNKSQESWKSGTNQPMSGANQALSYIVFIRDRLKFDENHPNLEVVLISPIGNYLRYILSGGINFIQLAPNFLIPTLKFLEKVLSPFNGVLALHYVIVIRKKVN